ncbi:hypothetical protein KDI_48050 [Dictyobacter arantiisoli]|uniref:CHRD domain-containing protein n=2 Tax=Dictyobacter arantiisoli TaxID=2014874 RepID=A0A5A5TI13_9CHLR|nr:hypothetical protein KDI_48050 [Dictyobacter arantiisoli]
MQGTIQLNLLHTPTGTTMLRWNPANRQLVVTVSLTGLAPNSIHPTHIHLGTCAAPAPQSMLFPLKTLRADGKGTATATTTIANVAQDIPGSGPIRWFVNVHNGPTLSTEVQNRWLACGDIASVQTGAGGVQSAMISLMGTSSADEHAAGTVVLSVEGQQVKVIVHVSGLIPGSRHMAHIHQGSCAAQGPVVAPLAPVIVDGHGNGISTTVLPLTSMSLPASALYLNVHEGPMPTTMLPIPQQLFNPIVCGDIPLPHA